VAEDQWKPALMFFKDTGGTETLARGVAASLISHGYEFKVLEDAEKWSFEVDYCTSGERMIIEGKVKNNGGASTGHHRFGSTSKGYPWSLGLSAFPYYDVHSTLWMKLLPAEWGWDVMTVEYEKKAHGELSIKRYIVYKQPRAPSV
jgi:hypothetical protein